VERCWLCSLETLGPGESAEHTETWQLFWEIYLGPTDATAAMTSQKSFVYALISSRIQR